MFCDCIKIYSKEGKYLVLNPTVPSWIVTNINGILLLKCYEENKSFEEIGYGFHEHCPSFSVSSAVTFLEYAKKNRLFEVLQDYQYFPGTLRNVYLHMTKNCNLHCSYCYTTDRPEDGFNSLCLAEVKDILNQVYKINNHACVTFTGGEALLENNTFSAAEYAKNLGLETYLLTNGTMIDDDNIAHVKNLFDHIKISMDGSTKEKYGRYRGEENYSKVKAAVENLIKLKADVMVSMVVTRENMDDVDNMAAMWGDRLNYMPLFPMGNAKEQEKGNSLTGKEYYKVLTNKAGIEPFADIVNILERCGCPNLKCAMGDGELSIAYNGDVYPCQLLHNKDCYLGNIRKNSLSEIIRMDKTKKFANHTIYEIDRCRVCDFRLLCGGACQARHYCETGSLDYAGEFCDYEKEGIINGIINRAELIQV